MSGDDKDPETPNEAVLLFAMIGIILGGTILINLIIYAIFPEISGWQKQDILLLYMYS